MTLPPMPWKWEISQPSDHHLKDLKQAEFKGKFDRSWYQGRGVFGGLTAAIILESMMYLEPQRCPRTFTLHCAAPVLEGDGTLRVVCERRGSKVSHLSAKLFQEGEVVAFASASFGEARRYSALIEGEKAPIAPEPNQVREVPINQALMPEFCQHFSYRFCLDGLPYAGTEKAAMGGWCRLRLAYELSYPYLACLLDAWAPALFSTLTQPMRAASVDFTYHFHCTPEELKQAQLPMLYHGQVLALKEGYAEERDQLWDRQGRLLASARQLIALS